jgi:Protein of unknown function (DUF3102)
MHDILDDAAARKGADESATETQANVVQLLSASSDQVLAEHADAIRCLGKRVLADVIEIGRLVDCRDNYLKHGEWLLWLKLEFGWSRQTADRFIHAFEASGKLPNLSNLGGSIRLSSLYLLTAPSTPEAVRTAIVKHAEAGAAISHAEVKNLIERARATCVGERKDTRRIKAKKPAAERAPSAAPQDPGEPVAEKAGEAGAMVVSMEATTVAPTPVVPTSAAECDRITADNNDEIARLTARIDELQNEKRQLEIKSLGLQDEINQLKTAQHAELRKLDTSKLLNLLSAKTREEIKRRVVGLLTVDELLAELERKLPGAPPPPKVRAAFKTLQEAQP